MGLSRFDVQRGARTQTKKTENVTKQRKHEVFLFSVVFMVIQVLRDRKTKIKSVSLSKRTEKQWFGEDSLFQKDQLVKKMAVTWTGLCFIMVNTISSGEASNQHNGYCDLHYSLLFVLGTCRGPVTSS